MNLAHDMGLHGFIFLLHYQMGNLPRLPVVRRQRPWCTDFRTQHCHQQEAAIDTAHGSVASRQAALHEARWSSLCMELLPPLLPQYVDD